MLYNFPDIFNCKQNLHIAANGCVVAVPGLKARPYPPRIKIVKSREVSYTRNPGMDTAQCYAQAIYPFIQTFE